MTFFGCLKMRQGKIIMFKNFIFLLLIFGIGLASLNQALASATQNDFQQFVQNHLKGLVEKNNTKPRLTDEQLDKSQILLGIHFEWLRTVPYFGFLNSNLAGRSSGSLSSSSTTSRSRFEEKIMVGPNVLFPKYAYYAPEGNLSVKRFLNQYGNILMEMRDEVKQNSTYTIGDSGAESSDLRPLRVGTNRNDKEKIAESTYFETQIWGGVWLNQVKNALVTKEIYESHIQWWTDMSQKFGFGIVLIEWQGTRPVPIKIISTPLEISNRAILSAAEIKDFIDKTKPKERKRWLEILGNQAIALPIEIQKELIAAFPEIKSIFNKQRKVFDHLLRETIINPQKPRHSRAEALRQWILFNYEIDFAMVEPIQLLIKDSVMYKALQKSRIDLNYLKNLKSEGRPVLTEPSEALWYLRSESGYRLAPEEINSIKQKIRTDASDWEVEIIAKYEPEIIFEEYLIRQSDKDYHLEKFLIKRTQAAILKKNDVPNQLVNLVKQSSPSIYSVAVMALLAEREPGKIADENLRRVLLNYIESHSSFSEYPASLEILGKIESTFVLPFADEMAYRRLSAWNHAVSLIEDKIENGKEYHSNLSNMEKDWLKFYSAQTCSKIFSK